MTIPQERLDQQEAWLREQCRAADCTPLQAEALCLRYVDGFPPAKILRVLAGSREAGECVRDKGDVLRLLKAGEERLSRLEGFWESARAFGWNLVAAVRNRLQADERPPDMRGVAPDHSVRERLPAATLIAGDDQRLRQDRASALRLWMQDHQITAALAG